MAVTGDIFASYLRPRRVFARLLARGVNDRIGIAYLLLAMGLGFVSQLPWITRRANLSDPEMEAAIRAEAGDVRQIEALDVPENMIDAKFEALLSAELFIWFFILPLFFYGLAAISQLVLRLFGRRPEGIDVRMALFWALLVATPLKLLHGLMAGMLGEGPALSLIGFVWVVVFVWVWGGNLSEAWSRGGGNGATGKPAEEPST